MKGIKKAVVLLISVLSCLIFALGLTGCGKRPAIYQDDPSDDLNEYIDYLGEARQDGSITPLLYEEWHDTVEAVKNNGTSAYTLWRELGKTDKLNAFIIAIQKKGKSAHPEIKGKEIDLATTKIEDGKVIVGFTDGSRVTQNIDIGEAFVGRYSANVDLTSSQILHFTFGAANTYADIYVSSVRIGCDTHSYSQNEVFAHTDEAKPLSGSKYETNGISYSSCKTCGALKIELTSGHEFDETIVEATCEKEGYTTRKCKNAACGYEAERADIVPALGHEKTTVIRFAHEDGRNECEDGRIKVTYCERCGKVFKAIVLEPEGHESVEWKVVKEPSNRNEGLLQGFCRKCMKEDATYVLPMFEPFVNNGLPYEWELEPYEVWNCSRKLDVHYWITVQGQRFDFHNGEYYLGYHTLKNDFGTEIFKDGDTTVHTYIEDEITSGKRNITIFGNRPITCKEEGDDASFKCNTCGQDVKIKIRTYHEPKEGTVVYNSGKSCLDEHSSNFACARCGDENAYGPIGHDYKIESVSSAGSGYYNVVVICTRDDLRVTVKTKDVVRNGGYATCTEPAEYNYTVTIKNNSKIVDKYGRTLAELVLESDTEIDPIKLHKLNGAYVAQKYVDGDEPMKYGNGVKVFDNTRPACTGNPVKGYFVCDTCGKPILVDVISNHVKKEGSDVFVDSTCKEEGYSQYTCAECGALVKTPIPAKGHKFEYTIKVEGNNYRIAEFEMHCIRCDVSVTLGDEELPSLPHITYKTVYSKDSEKTGDSFYKIAEVIKPATCAEEGECKYSFVVILDGREETVEFIGPMLKEQHEVDYSDDELVIEWELTIDKVTYIYKGRLCKKCNEVVEITHKIKG